jgi:hypothetical protein
MCRFLFKDLQSTHAAIAESFVAAVVPSMSHPPTTWLVYSDMLELV